MQPPIRLTAFLITIAITMGMIQPSKIQQREQWSNTVTGQALWLVQVIPARAAYELKIIPPDQNEGLKDVIRTTRGGVKTKRERPNLPQGSPLIEDIKRQIDEGDLTMGKWRGETYLFNWPNIPPIVLKDLVAEAVGQDRAVNLSAEELQLRFVPSIGITLKTLYLYLVQRVDDEQIPKTGRWMLLEAAGCFDHLSSPLPTLSEIRTPEDLKKLLTEKALLRIPWTELLKFNRLFLRHLVILLANQRYYNSRTSISYGQMSPITEDDLRHLDPLDYVRIIIPGLEDTLADFLMNFWGKQTPAGKTPALFLLEQLFPEFFGDVRQLRQAYTLQALAQLVPLPASGLWENLSFSVRRALMRRHSRMIGRQTMDDLLFASDYLNVPVPPLSHGIFGLVKILLTGEKSSDKKAPPATIQVYDINGFVRTSQVLGSCLAAIEAAWELNPALALFVPSLSKVGGLRGLSDPRAVEDWLDLALLEADRFLQEQNEPLVILWRAGLEAYWQVFHTVQWMPLTFEGAAAGIRSASGRDILETLIQVSGSAVLTDLATGMAPPSDADDVISSLDDFRVGQPVMTREGPGTVARIDEEGGAREIFVELQNGEGLSFIDPAPDDLWLEGQAPSNSKRFRQKERKDRMQSLAAFLPAAYQSATRHDILLERCEANADMAVRVILVGSRWGKAHELLTVLFLDPEETRLEGRAEILASKDRRRFFAKTINIGPHGKSPIQKGIRLLLQTRSIASWSSYGEESRKDAFIYQDIATPDVIAQEQNGRWIVREKPVAVLTPLSLGIPSDIFNRRINDYRTAAAALALTDHLGIAERVGAEGISALTARRDSLWQTIDGENSPTGNYIPTAIGRRRGLESFEQWRRTSIHRDLSAPLATIQLDPARFGDLLLTLETLGSPEIAIYLGQVENFLRTLEDRKVFDHGMAIWEKVRAAVPAINQDIQRASWKRLNEILTSIPTDFVLQRIIAGPPEIDPVLENPLWVFGDALTPLRAMIRAAVKDRYSMSEIGRWCHADPVNLTRIEQEGRSVHRDHFVELMERMSNIPKRGPKLSPPPKDSDSISPEARIRLINDMEEILSAMTHLRTKGQRVEAVKARTGVSIRTLWGILGKKYGVTYGMEKKIRQGLGILGSA